MKTRLDFTSLNGRKIIRGDIIKMRPGMENLSGLYEGETAVVLDIFFNDHLNRVGIEVKEGDDSRRSMDFYVLDAYILA